MQGENRPSDIPEAFAATIRRSAAFRCPHCGAELTTDSSAPPSSRPRAFHSAETARLSDIARREVVTVRAAEGLGALPLLFANTDTDFAVVVDDDARALGVVTPAIVFRSVAEHGRSTLLDMHALDAAAAGALFMRGGTDVASAIQRFTSDPSARCVVVVDDDERLLGIVTHREALGILARDSVSAEAPTLPGEGAAWGGVGDR